MKRRLCRHRPHCRCRGGRGRRPGRTFRHSARGTWSCRAGPSSWRTSGAGTCWPSCSGRLDGPGHAAAHAGVRDRRRILPRDPQPEGGRPVPRAGGRPARQRRDRQPDDPAGRVERHLPAAGERAHARREPAVPARLSSTAQLGAHAQGQVPVQRVERPDVRHGAARAHLVLDPGPRPVPEPLPELRDVLPAELRHHGHLPELPLPDRALARHPRARDRAFRRRTRQPCGPRPTSWQRPGGAPTARRSLPGGSRWESCTRRASERRCQPVPTRHGPYRSISTATLSTFSRSRR